MQFIQINSCLMTARDTIAMFEVDVPEDSKRGLSKLLLHTTGVDAVSVITIETDCSPTKLQLMLSYYNSLLDRKLHPEDVVYLDRFLHDEVDKLATDCIKAINKNLHETIKQIEELRSKTNQLDSSIYSSTDEKEFESLKRQRNKLGYELHLYEKKYYLEKELIYDDYLRKIMALCGYQIDSTSKEK